MNSLMICLDHRLWSLDVLLEALASLVATDDKPVFLNNVILGQDLVKNGFAQNRKGGTYLPTKKTDKLLHAVKQALQVEVPK
jgi:hypothetical protein